MMRRTLEETQLTQFWIRTLYPELKTWWSLSTSLSLFLHFLKGHKYTYIYILMCIRPKSKWRWELRRDSRTRMPFFPEGIWSTWWFKFGFLFLWGTQVEEKNQQQGSFRVGNLRRDSSSSNLGSPECYTFHVHWRQNRLIPNLPHKRNTSTFPYILRKAAKE